MKILSPDAADQVDWSIRTNILAHLPDLPVDLVPTTWLPNFSFREPQTNRYVLLDFLEQHEPNAEYDKFWAWVTENPPILIFRRELKQTDAATALLPMFPIEFPGYIDPPEPIGREIWASRAIQCLFWWGFSHQSRPRLHADIYRGMAEDGLDVLSSWEAHLAAPAHPNRWLTIHTPHYQRKPMVEILEFMSAAKVTVAMPGNGLKTFRHSECTDTLMACWRDGLAWSYPWTDENSIQLTPHFEYQDLRKALETDLYPRYVACCANMRNYHAPVYAKNYVAKEIEKVL